MEAVSESLYVGVLCPPRACFCMYHVPERSMSWKSDERHHCSSTSTQSKLERHQTQGHLKGNK
jgi:hypothetical protein